jgi:hypothetical protein
MKIKIEFESNQEKIDYERKNESMKIQLIKILLNQLSSNDENKKIDSILRDYLDI